MRFTSLLLALAALLVLAPAQAAEPPGAARPQPAEYLQRLRAAGIPTSAAGVFVRAVAGPDLDRALSYSANDAEPMNPASTMKIVTTYSALHLLGPAFTFRTELLADGAITGDVLNGDLNLRGGGDPKLVIEDLWLLVNRLRAFGVREVRGDLVLDKSMFEPLPHDPASFDGEEGRAYNVGPDALLVNFKSIAVSFVPDAAAKVARVLVVPEVAGMKFPRTVRGVEGACGDWRGRLAANFDDPMAARIAGVYPLACGERTIYLGALEHTSYLGAVFRGLWERQGGLWTGKVREGGVGANARLIAAQESPPLALLIRDINKFSNNVMTQQLFLTLGAASGEKGSFARGAVAVRNLLGARGIATPGLVLENGCGLSRIERISAGGLGAVLVDAWKSPWMSELMASFPISGVDGTLQRRNIAAGAAHMKTGMLEDVRSIAGFVQAASGRRYVVVALINHPLAGRGTGAHDALVDWVYEAG
jgi:D-alanyl-D-alanine carboxypeptidase/D-alanyl-D-alanine-endopeptidase (penicillin-binding protein 4)